MFCQFQFKDGNFGWTLYLFEKSFHIKPRWVLHRNESVHAYMKWQQSYRTSHLEMNFIFMMICVFIIYLCYSMFKRCPGLKERDRVTWAESLSHLYRILCEKCKNLKFKRKNSCTKYHLVKQPYTLSGVLYTFNQLLSEQLTEF